MTVERLNGGEMIPIEGFVWCYVHGIVHADTTNPYDSEGDVCTSEEHRKIALRARKGDYR